MLEQQDLLLKTSGIVMTPTQNNSHQPALPNRELSWQVAENLLVSFKYAWEGVRYAFNTQRNFRIHLVLGSLAISGSLILHLQLVEIAVIGLTSGLVLTGISLDLIRELGPSLPILGVCLGHQSIGQVFGGKIVSAPVLMHGKTSSVHHTGVGVFQEVESPLMATRYHSLVIDRETCPEVLEITAWVEDKTIMGVRHRQYPHIQGVQFHPESILTKAGKQLLRNFLNQL